MKRLTAGIMTALLAMTWAVSESNACSRVVYEGDSSLLIVGRSLDWKTPIPTNLYVYPRGMAKSGNSIAGSVKWTSKYGAVYAVGYDGGVTEGMNEKGLVVSGLFCKGTVYVNEKTSGKRPMSLAMFVAWMLDCFGTTDELVAELRKQDFTISGSTFDGGTVSALHWGITDEKGHCAILEFDHGNVRIFEGDSLRVLTNDPQYPDMCAINKYWQGVGGRNMLPGTVKSPDRFVRADYFNNHVGKTADASLGVAITRSVLVNVSVPYLYTIETEPNVSSTQWRSFSNIRDKLYYFDLVTNLGMYYIDLKKCDLRPGAKVMKLVTSDFKNYAGDITPYLIPTNPFTPMY